ncbi:peroxisomal enoyl-CoA-hydratase [Mycena leptocephala]|nr:peroxisomal enoyl-CoA-hydratase [Mycena leptocephala]
MSAPDYSALGLTTLLVSLDGAVLVVLMNRSKQRNSWIGSVPKELQQVFDLADRDDRVRVVVLSSEHTAPAFCAGADISGGWDVLWDPEEEKEGPHAHRDSGGKTSLAGVGMTAMQLPFDFRFVWAGAKLTFPFVAVESYLKASATSSYLLPRLLGHSRANSLLLTGATFTPESPLVQGLYHQIFPTREELAATTSQVSVAVAKGLIQNPGNSAEENHLYDSRAMRHSAQLPTAKKASGRSRTAGAQWRQVNTKHRNSKL